MGNLYCNTLILESNQSPSSDQNVSLCPFTKLPAADLLLPESSCVDSCCHQTASDYFTFRGWGVAGKERDVGVRERRRKKEGKKGGNEWKVSAEVLEANSYGWGVCTCQGLPSCPGSILSETSTPWHKTVTSVKLLGWKIAWTYFWEKCFLRYIL